MGKTKYYFIDKEGLRKTADRINALVEKMYEGFHEWKGIKEALIKDSYVEFTNLASIAGLSDKLMKKLENAVEKFRELYFARMTDIFQTTIEDFVGTKKG